MMIQSIEKDNRYELVYRLTTSLLSMTVIDFLVLYINEYHLVRTASVDDYAKRTSSMSVMYRRKMREARMILIFKSYFWNIDMKYIWTHVNLMIRHISKKATE